MRIIRLRDVMRCTGLSRSTIYKFIEQGIFPKSVSLGGRAVGWVEEEVLDWVQARIEERDVPRGVEGGMSASVSSVETGRSTPFVQKLAGALPCQAVGAGEYGWTYTYRYSVGGARGWLIG